jgi:hypothetical protein
VIGFILKSPGQMPFTYAEDVNMGGAFVISIRTDLREKWRHMNTLNATLYWGTLEN